MSQHAYSIPDQSGASFLFDINDLAGAIASSNSGTTEPAVKYAYMPWADTTSGIFKIRNSLNTAWVSVFNMATGALIGNAATATTAGTCTGNAATASNGASSGTRAPFNQTAAPTGWTKDTTAALNDTAMRIVTGTVGSGGANAFSSAAYSPTLSGNTDGHALTIAELASHNHAPNGGTGQFVTEVTSGGNLANPAAGSLMETRSSPNATTGSTGSGAAHSHALTGAGVSSITLSLKYNDFIIATKD